MVLAKHFQQEQRCGLPYQSLIAEIGNEVGTSLRDQTTNMLHCIIH